MIILIEKTGFTLEQHKMDTLEDTAKDLLQLQPIFIRAVFHVGQRRNYL